jgi:hypothetical protein
MVSGQWPAAEKPKENPSRKQEGTKNGPWFYFILSSFVFSHFRAFVVRGFFLISLINSFRHFWHFSAF